MIISTPADLLYPFIAVNNFMHIITILTELCIKFIPNETKQVTQHFQTFHTERK